MTTSFVKVEVKILKLTVQKGYRHSFHHGREKMSREMRRALPISPHDHNSGFRLTADWRTKRPSSGAFSCHMSAFLGAGGRPTPKPLLLMPQSSRLNQSPCAGCWTLNWGRCLTRTN